jgi:hypothetical protein
LYAPLCTKAYVSAVLTPFPSLLPSSPLLPPQYYVPDHLKILEAIKETVNY